MTNPNLQSPEWLKIGTIVAAQGLQGEVRVIPDSDFPERFEKPGKRWLLRSGQNQPETVQLQRGRLIPKKGLYVMKFAEISSREAAEDLRGAVLLVPQSDRPKLQPGEFYLQDLVGMEVFEQSTQTKVGAIVGVIAAGNDLLEVQPENPDQPPILIPLVREIVPVVDIANRRLEITPPAGLLPNVSLPFKKPNVSSDP